MLQQSTISILVADDHPVVRDGLSRLIGDEEDMVLVGEASNGSDAVSLFRELMPSLALIDLKMPGLDGVAATRQILQVAPEAKVILLTSYSGDVQATRAFEAGASGFLLKDSLRNDLITSIRAVLAGRIWIPPAIAEEMKQHVHADRLTNRELDVLKKISDGLSNKRVAAELGLSEETVKSYVKNLIGKLQANDRTHAVTIALRRGYLDL